MRLTLALALSVTVAANAAEPAPIANFWPKEKAQEILAKTETIRLAPDLSRLTPAEHAAVKELLAAGEIFQRIYEDQRHHQALAARAAIERSDREDLRQIYRLSMGPIATTLDNRREPIVGVDPQVAARNVYPVDATKEEIEKFLAANPTQRDAILGERTVVRRATVENLQRDLAALHKYAAINALHPGLARDLIALAKAPGADLFYAVPYSVAWAEEMTTAFGHLNTAADHIDDSDPEFARYLRNRARDLLSDDYESGDASWVTGRFKRLNAEIGSYETYDDALFGVKAFHALSLLLVNEEATAALRKALGGLQAVEDALPYEQHKRVREDIPVGVYEVIADFGQARGINTATILPNDALFSRRYGRTILLRENIMKNPQLFASDERLWRAVVAPAHAAELTSQGNFDRTLWHEIGHYLGVDRDKRGRTLDVALEDYADSIEEMKADLVSLFALHRLNIPAESLRAVQASGIRRTLQNVKPRTDQPYQRMQLVQFNWFREKGLISLDPKTAKITIHYDRYPEVVTSLLEEVLKMQQEGDTAAAAKFFERWTEWTPQHEQLAKAIRDAQGARFRIVTYAALGE